MTSSVTMKLSGNLGERHRSFNALVHEVYQQNTPLSVQHSPEEATLDRLFKIDLASKQRNVDYIIQTLKDDDLLYVSRALKSLWLLEPQYSNIINPIYLENELFPDMTLPAVNKIRHWIPMHLRDSQRCNEFYEFYKEANFDIAAKFFWHCSNEYVLSEFSNIMDKITPKLLKRISEKVSQVTKIYYDCLKDSQTLLKYYLENDSKFFANIKYLLKTDADVFFYVLENFFVPEFRSFNGAITKYIMKNHKGRFLLKPELYTARFLDMDTLARYLSIEEIKNLVLTLARAEYLQSWFSYQKVEPLIKRLSKEDGVVLKNLVFVDKAIGSTIKEWPYPIPTPPELITPQTNLFEDTIKDPYSISDFCPDSMDFRAMLRKRKYAKWACVSNTLTYLDQLFNKYRFFNFRMTLLELRKQLRAESSPQNREFMLLVLISKTGGKTEDVVALLDLLSEYKNEPVHIRAALVRSLVKRAFVWRLPAEPWARLLEWGHGLGLDGSPSEADCQEGLHAVVLRDLLTDVEPSEAVWKMFLTNYIDNLHRYSLTVDERNCVRVRLPALLLATVQSNPDEPQLSLLQFLLNTLEVYHIKFDELPGVVEAILAAVKLTNSQNMDGEASRSLLQCLYNAGTARKHLIKEYFEINQTNASYVNALRHDVSILYNTRNFEKVIEGEDFKHEAFFRTLALYFTEKDGLAERYRVVLELRATTAPNKTLARPLALLAGSTFPSIVKDFDASPSKTPQRQLAAALRSNAHVVRPAFDLESFGWRQAGAKAVNNHVASCRQTDVERNLQECLIWRRTLRIALALARRVNKERDAFEVLASQRPGAALQAALRYFRREQNGSDVRIWELVKSHILKLDERQLLDCIQFIHTIYVPPVIKAEYCFLVHIAYQQNILSQTRNRRINRSLSKIPDILQDLNEQCIFDAIDTFLNNHFTDCLQFTENIVDNASLILLNIEIVAKFLVLSTSEDMLEERYRRVALPFLNQLELFWKQIPNPDDAPIEKILDSFLFYLRYNKVYFDVKYVSSLPVFEKITEWMHGFLPIEKWFDKYVTVHLTMTYLKTVQHCLKQNSALLLDKTIEGAYMLGSIFGKFLGNEINELALKYFPTIIEIYGSELGEYFGVYYMRYDGSIEKFKMGVLNGLLSTKSVAACVLAKHIFMDFRNQFNSEYVKEISNKFKESEIVELSFEINND